MFNLSELLKTEFTVKFENVLRQTWNENYVWSCISNPKSLHLFLLIENGKVHYTLKNGRKLSAKSGDLVYIPAGSEYETKFLSDENSIISSIGVNFKLFNENNEYLTANEIFIFDSSSIKNVIYEIERLSYTYNQIKNKFNEKIYNIFNLLSDEFYNLKFEIEDFFLIKKGVEFLHENFNKNYEILELAKICNLSEVYFRRLFKKHFKLTPIEYRNELRLKKACDYLKYTTTPISLIAENLGFTDSAYFVLKFKEKYKTTPLNFRKMK